MNGNGIRSSVAKYLAHNPCSIYVCIRMDLILGTWWLMSSLSKFSSVNKQLSKSTYTTNLSCTWAKCQSDRVQKISRQPETKAVAGRPKTTESRAHSWSKSLMTFTRSTRTRYTISRPFFATQLYKCWGTLCTIDLERPWRPKMYYKLWWPLANSWQYQE